MMILNGRIGILVCLHTVKLVFINLLRERFASITVVIIKWQIKY